jgi:hypothetical protein
VACQKFPEFAELVFAEAVHQGAWVTGQVAQDLAEEAGRGVELAGQLAPLSRVAGGQADRGGPAGLEGRFARSGCCGAGDDGLGGCDTGAVAVPGEHRDQDGESAPQRVKLLGEYLLARWRAAGRQEPGKGGGRAV